MNKPQVEPFDKGGAVGTDREYPSVQRVAPAPAEEPRVRDSRTLDEALEETFPASDPPASGVFD